MFLQDLTSEVTAAFAEHEHQVALERLCLILWFINDFRNKHETRKQNQGQDVNGFSLI